MIGDLGDYMIPEWNRTTFVSYKLKITHLIRNKYCAYNLQLFNYIIFLLNNCT